MSYDDKMRSVLKKIDSGEIPKSAGLSLDNGQEIIEIIKECENEGFLSHSSHKQKLVETFYNHEFMLHPSTRITRRGYNFIEGKEDNIAPTQNFTIGEVHSSHIGNYGTVNNYLSENPIEDLKDYINEIQDPNDKATAEELVTTLETEEIKPGLLKRFDTLIGKYDNIAKLVGTVATTILMNAT